MTLDTSAWKINDPEWVKEREEKWPIFEEWIRQRYSMIDYYNNKDLTGNISNSKNFYMTGFLSSDIEKSSDRVGFENSLALIPNIQWNTARQILRFYIDSTNRIDFKGCFFPFYLAGSKYIDLIEKEIIEKDFFLQFLKGVYGNSLAEAAQILEFEVEKVCLGLFQNLSDKLLLYYIFGDASFNGDVARFMLPFYLDCLTKLKDEHEAQCDFYFNTLIEIKSEEYDLQTVTDIKRVEYMKDFLEAIKKNLVNTRPWVQQKLSPLFD